MHHRIDHSYESFRRHNIYSKLAGMQYWRCSYSYCTSYLVHRTVLLILNLLICISQKSFLNSPEQVSSKFGRRFRQILSLRCYAVTVYSASVMYTTHPLTDSFPNLTTHFFALDFPPKPLIFLQRHQKWTDKGEVSEA